MNSTPPSSADAQNASSRREPQVKSGAVAKRVVKAAPPSAAASNANDREALPANEGQRLSKVVMALEQCSRAQAERLIEAGRVQVDGATCQDVPRRITPNQRVEVTGAGPVNAIAPATLLVHKPAGMTQQAVFELFTSAHQEPAPSGQQLLKKHLQHLQCIAPLEAAASGLVVWTQHPTVARLFEEPPGLEHELMAEVQGAVSVEQLQALHRPNQARRHDLPWPLHIKASISHTTPKLTRVRLAIKGYQPGDALDLCQQAGLRLQHLWRIRIGRVALKQLPEQQWRFLQGYERF
jgi:23S rRNA pseudouridine2604 synthase